MSVHLETVEWPGFGQLVTAAREADEVASWWEGTEEKRGGEGLRSKLSAKALLEMQAGGLRVSQG